MTDDVAHVSTGSPLAPEITSHVVDVALKRFSQATFSQAKLEGIAQESGMSKRMIHYHFGSKKGLYHRALIEAVQRIQPSPDLLPSSSAIPVDGMRATVHAVYQGIVNDPVAAKLLTMEAAQKVLHLEGIAPLIEQSTVILHLDRLLMLGQDSGAFRPGISATDIYYLVFALSCYRLTGRDIVMNMFSLDLTDPGNTEGIDQLVVDTVLAFLTANIPDNGHASYLTTPLNNEMETQTTIYD